MIEMDLEVIWEMSANRDRDIEIAKANVQSRMAGQQRRYEAGQAEKQRDHEVSLQQRQNEIDNSRDRQQRLHDWMQFGTRFLVIGNAGGAVATLTFIGTLIGKEASYKPAVLSLTLFAFGVLLVGLVILGQLQKAWLEELSPNTPPDPSNPAGRLSNRFFDRAADFHRPMLFASFGCMVFGAAAGILLLVI